MVVARGSWLVVGVLGASVVMVDRPALADTSDQDAARAQALFDEGKRLMEAKDYAHACPKLAESQRLDPGGGTLLALGFCHEAQGKTASAWADFGLAETAARHDGRADRVQAAQEHIRALEPRLVKVAINVSPQPGDVDVACDGTALGKAEWGMPVPVDPGPHTVTASAPGKEAWSTSVDASAEGTTVTVTVPVLESAAVAPAPPPASPQAPAQPEAPSSRSNGGPWKTVGLVTVGVGVVGLGVGSAFGILAMSRKSDAQNGGCSGQACPPSAAPARDDARTDATLSTVLFVAGGALAAAGVTLWLFAPSSSQASAPRVGLRVQGASAAVVGSW